jgi:hypothetical protein
LVTLTFPEEYLGKVIELCEAFGRVGDNLFGATLPHNLDRDGGWCNDNTGAVLLCVGYSDIPRGVLGKGD